MDPLLGNDHETTIETTVKYATVQKPLLHTTQQEELLTTTGHLDA
jgi:hypothetical protein